MSLRNLPSADMTDEKNVKLGAAADDAPSGASGKYVAEIVQASLNEAPNGSVFLSLSLKMPNGKIYKQAGKQIQKADETDGFYMNKVRALMGVTGARDTVGSAMVKESEFVDGNRVEVEREVLSYIDLIGKKVCVIVNFYQEYPNMGINGYTNEPTPAKNEDEAGYNAARQSPTTIWMPNYEKKSSPVCDFAQFFHPETEKSFAEMTDDNCLEPVAVAAKLEEILKKNHSAVQWDAERWDKERLKQLKASLKKANVTFDASQFIPFATTSKSGNAPQIDDAP